MESQQWQFVCRACEGSKLRIQDIKNDDAPVTCSLCGASLGSLGELKLNMMLNATGEANPSTMVAFRKVETRH